jgi:NADH-quinone oxidoreductase subunit C
MEAALIVEQLKKKFGDKIGAFTADNPDPFVLVDRQALVEVCQFLKHEPALELDFLPSVSGLDLKDKVQVVYHLWSYKHRHGIVLKVELAPSDLSVPTVSGVWRAANWLEREQYDLFGVVFTGHPDLRRIMLPEDWVGHPLRKDYVFPTQYHGIEHYRPSLHDQFKAKDEVAAKVRAAAAPPPPPAPTTLATPEKPS